jgi:hypothetical protein
MKLDLLDFIQCNEMCDQPNIYILANRIGKVVDWEMQPDYNSIILHFKRLQFLYFNNCRCNFNGLIPTFIKTQSCASILRNFFRDFWEGISAKSSISDWSTLCWTAHVENEKVILLSSERDRTIWKFQIHVMWKQRNRDNSKFRISPPTLYEAFPDPVFDVPVSRKTTFLFCSLKM